MDDLTVLMSHLKGLLEKGSDLSWELKKTFIAPGSEGHPFSAGETEAEKRKCDH